MSKIFYKNIKFPKIRAIVVKITPKIVKNYLICWKNFTIISNFLSKSQASLLTKIFLKNFLLCYAKFEIHKNVSTLVNLKLDSVNFFEIITTENYLLNLGLGKFSRNQEKFFGRNFEFTILFSRNWKWKKFLQNLFTNLRVAYTTRTIN